MSIKSLESLRLLGYQTIRGEIECKTGLRIGGSSEVIEIGGLDNPVIKHPISMEPYIPGSSLKGKMRSLLELKLNLVEKNGDVHKYERGKCGLECPICRIFGVGGAEGSPFGPGRLIVHDAKIDRINGQREWDKDLTLTERKWENVINRIKGTAEHPRQMERAPSGSVFAFEIDYRVFSLTIKEDGSSEPKDDNGEVDKRLFDWVLKGLKLIELDTLGGSGSRGYGKVSFGDLNITYVDGTTNHINIERDIKL